MNQQSTSQDFKHGFIAACLLLSVAGVVVIGIWNDGAEQRFIDDCVASIEH